MEDQAELIRQRMAETRADLTDKLENIEHKVTTQLTDAQEAVTGTAEAVKENVVETVEAVKESLDVTRYVREYPWLMVGGGVVAGFLAYELLSAGSSAATSSSQGSTGRSGGSWAGGLASGLTSGLAGGLTGGLGLGSLFGDQFQQLEKFAARTALQLVSSAIKDSVPGEFGTTLCHTVDKLASSLDEDKSSSGQQAPGGQTAGAH
jgi:ElaB/YqjD/DUF883 family membrane-anchored ribosome-binding protein